ncbi:hypothetical protein EX30DRAFT_366275 [Ascodesmis nigricans]|uniref:Uncharacterized protein n=1 Tax=Ascodesmis nigricans TaxID=341454 RepID=A0A4S2MRX2_9PEZI|nr:hypothetical protein EX30DRAFT_366275 [Ascodesmis nigricans]
MKFTTAISLFSSLLLVSATLETRQSSGLTKYECHSTCGKTINLTKSSPSPCTDATVLDAYAQCHPCAQEHDIWRFYGPSLSAVAECEVSSGDDTAAPAESSAPISPAASTVVEAPGAAASVAPSVGVEGNGTATNGTRPGTGVPIVEEDASVVNAVSVSVIAAAVAVGLMGL